MPAVCVLGSINMDLVVRAPRFPAPGETLLGHSFATFPGGKGANQAVAAARAAAPGTQVAMIGRVGADPWGAELRALLEREGVVATHVLAREGVPTGVAVITVVPGGENHIVVAPGANGTLSPADADEAATAIAAADLLVAQLEIPLEAIERAAQVAKRAGTRVLLNAAPARALPSELLGMLDILVANEGEARLLAGADFPPADLARRLRALGPATAVVTFGFRGALLDDGVRLLEQPAFEVQPLDTTAAGDAFAGALACALAEGLSPEVALRRACAAGALATTVAGAMPSLPRRAAIERLTGQP